MQPISLLISYQSEFSNLFTIWMFIFQIFLVEVFGFARGVFISPLDGWQRQVKMIFRITRKT